MKAKKHIQSLEEAMSKFDIHSYDVYVVTFSGGKDSLACFLYLLDQGIPLEKIELMHHDIDGREGSSLMDWPITRGYCKAFAVAFNVPIYFSWKEGGFEKEMTRNQSLTAPTIFENQDGSLSKVGGTQGKLNTRLKFPQVSPDLSVRWCSSYLKIDVCASAIRNQERFDNVRTLVLSGERGEESAARGGYNILENDRSDLRDGKTITRHVDRLRPIRDWKEEQVWDIIRKYKIRVHPAYYLGWSRVSCLFCIFGNKDQWKSASIVSPTGIKKIIDYEKEFGVTIKRKESIEELIEKGVAYSGLTQEELLKIARSEQYELQIVMNDNEQWTIPIGAYGKSCGPQ